MLVWKEAIIPGVYHLPGRPPFVCRPEDVRYHVGRIKEILGSRPVPLSLPGTWEHQTDVGIQKRDDFTARQRQNAELARLTFGHVHDARINAAGNGEVLLDVQDDADVKTLKRVKNVSPYIVWNVQTPDGKTWPGPSIVHIAATAVPVQWPQKPFDFAAGGVAPKTKPVAAVPLSQTGYQPPVCLSQATYQPGVPDMADEKEPRDKGDEEPMPKEAQEAPAEEAPPVAEAPAPEPVTPAIPPPPDPQMQALVSVLHQLNLPVGEDTTQENLVERLLVAARAKLAHEAEAAAAEAAENQAPNPMLPETTVSAEQTTPVMMSQLEQAKGKIVQTHREALKARVRAIAQAGVLPKPRTDALMAELEGAPIALSASFDPDESGVALKITAYEEAVRAVRGGFTAPSAVALSQEGEQDVTATAHGTEKKLDPHVMNRLTGGRYQANGARN